LKLIIFEISFNVYSDASDCSCFMLKRNQNIFNLFFAEAAHLLLMYTIYNS